MAFDERSLDEIGKDYQENGIGIHFDRENGTVTFLINGDADATITIEEYEAKVQDVTKEIAERILNGEAVDVSEIAFLDQEKLEAIIRESIPDESINITLDDDKVIIAISEDAIKDLGPSETDRAIELARQELMEEHDNQGSVIEFDDMIIWAPTEDTSEFFEKLERLKELSGLTEEIREVLSSGGGSVEDKIANMSDDLRTEWYNFKSENPEASIIGFETHLKEEREQNYADLRDMGRGKGISVDVAKSNLEQLETDLKDVTALTQEINALVDSGMSENEVIANMSDDLKSLWEDYKAENPNGDLEGFKQLAIEEQTKIENKLANVDNALAPANSPLQNTAPDAVVMPDFAENFIQAMNHGGEYEPIVPDANIDGINIDGRDWESYAEYDGQININELVEQDGQGIDPIIADPAIVDEYNDIIGEIVWVVPFEPDAIGIMPDVTPIPPFEPSEYSFDQLLELVNNQTMVGGDQTEYDTTGPTALSLT